MFRLFDPSADTRISPGATLPHWFQPGATYFVTFRTADSIPTSVSRRWHAARDAWLERHGISRSERNWKNRFAELPESERKDFHESFSRQYMAYLDRGWGSCPLRNPELSRVVAESLIHFDEVRYHLANFVVMPNHVHVLLGLRGGTDIQKQCWSWKQYTGRRINKALGRSGSFWQPESFDHLVRTPGQFVAIQLYIQDNPRNLRPGEYHLHLVNRAQR